MSELTVERDMRVADGERIQKEKNKSRHGQINVNAFVPVL
jgi:hypothetical protein